MRRFVITQKGQPSDYIARMARTNTTPRGQVNPPARAGTFGQDAADTFEQTAYLLSGGGPHPTTPPMFGDIDVEQAPLYRVPSAAQVIHSAMNHPTNPGTRVVSESLGSALARARNLYF